jgi:cytochrome c-type biogenesis protein CcmE
MVRPTSRRRGLALGVAVIVLIAAFGYLLYGGIGNNLVYFLTPGELLAKGTAALDVPVRLGGQIVPGSVEWNAETLDLRFRVTDGTREVAVRSTGAPPQMFRPGIGVIVEGTYDRAGLFHATNLMVRHSNEYHPPAAGHSPKEAYKSLISGAAQ